MLLLLFLRVLDLYHGIGSDDRQSIATNRDYMTSKRDEFLKAFIRKRNSQNHNINIFEVGRQCSMDNLSSSKMAIELEEEGILKAQGSGSTYHLTLKGRKNLL